MDTQPEAKTVENKPAARVEAKPEAKAVEPTPEVKATPQFEAKAEPQPDVTPETVKRVHELYEQLGREDVQAVQGLEKKAGRKI